MAVIGGCACVCQGQPVFPAGGVHVRGVLSTGGVPVRDIVLAGGVPVLAVSLQLECRCLLCFL